MKANGIANILRKNRVAFAYLFGSQAKGRSNKRSDRDIAVHFNPGTDARQRHALRTKLWSQLSDHWPEQPIDLIALEEAPLLLRFNVVRDGKLFYSANEKQRIGFEVPTMRDYFDRQFYIERGARMALKAYARRGLDD